MNWIVHDHSSPFAATPLHISKTTQHDTISPSHETMSEKNGWFCLHDKWHAQWVNWWEDLSEKLEALETSATEKLKDLSDTSGALATKVRSGWKEGMIQATGC